MSVILVVDDRPELARLAGLLISGAGYEVDVVHSGLDALAAIQRRQIDLMVLDESMPEMNGLEVLRILHGAGDNDDPRDQFPFPLPVVVMFSALEEARNDALALGAAAFVSKSNPRLLLPAVVQHLVTQPRV